jgi:hypothetical protein
MGDCTAVVRCDRIESLATLPKSQKKQLVEPDENGYGYLILHVEGHEYLAARDPDRGIRVSRIDVDGLPRFKRVRQAIVEFFTHQLHDFFRLRGVGTRASRIASVVQGWTQYPDGTEHTRGPARFMSPSVTTYKPGVKDTTSKLDYDKQLRNHCRQQIDRVKVTSDVAPLNDRDRACLRNVVGQLFRNPPPRRPHTEIPTLDDAACEAILRSSFARRTDSVAAQQVLDDLVVELGAIARKPRTDGGAVNSPAVYQARLLLLARALSANQRTPQQALALLQRLKQGDALHDYGDTSEIARQCWQVARLLAGTECGLRLLCELVQPPPGMADNVKPQWQAALKIYLESADHLVASSESVLRKLQSRTTELKARIGHRDFHSELQRLAVENNTSRTLLDRELVRVKVERLQAELAQFQSERQALWTATEQATALLNAWCGAPLTASKTANAHVRDAQHAKENRLPHRALHAAAKLLHIRDLVNTEWLDAQGQDGADSMAPNDNSLDRDDVMALAIWRNGYRDDGDSSALADFGGMLNKLVNEWQPHEERDPDTGEVRHRMSESSPIALALGHPSTAAITRRSIPEQAEDYHAAVGQAARLLVLQLKVAQGLPLLPYEALLKEALDLRDAIGAGAVDGDAMAGVDGKFDVILKEIDDAVRIQHVEESELPYSAKDLSRFHRRVGQRAEEVEDIQDRLTEIRYAFGLQRPNGILPTTTAAASSIAIPATDTKNVYVSDAVRCSLLVHWLRCTEIGLRWQTYRIDEAARNAVISDLADIPYLASHQQAIKAQLETITAIDHALLSTWAEDAGLRAPHHANMTSPHAPTAVMASPEASRRFQRCGQIITVLRSGGDNVDLDADFHGVPQSRDDYRRVAKHYMNVSLGSGCAGEVTNTGGIRFAASISPGYAVPLVGAPPAIAFSSQETTSATRRFAVSGSSVGGHTITASEKLSHRNDFEVGFKASGMVAVGVDSGYAEGDMLERGIALRFPPIPGSRAWVNTGEQTVDVLFGDRLAKDAITHHAASGRAVGDVWRIANVETLKSMCWQSFHSLLNGTLALNFYSNRTKNQTINGGISASMGASIVDDDMVSVSANMRIGLEKDRVLRQSRVDEMGSTRVEVHGIGTGSRRTASLKLLANLLPATLLDRIHSGLSLGTLAGISVTYGERGIQHIIRQETRDGVVQPSLAWDMVFRFVDDLIAHMNQPAVREHWQRFNRMQSEAHSEILPLDRVLRTIRLHASHSNQHYMVRRYLKADRLDELNAMSTMAKGLHRGSEKFSAMVDAYALVQRCRTLLESDASYEFGGVGVYSNDREETEMAVDGSLIQKRTESVSVSTESLWFSARLEAPSLNNKIVKATDMAETDPSIVARPRWQAHVPPTKVTAAVSPVFA